MKKKIILTGSTGFLGSLFLKKYEKDYEFVCIGKNEKVISKNLIQYNINKINIDIIPQRVSVLHLATFYSKKDEDRSLIKDANIDFGLKLLDLFKDRNLVNFVYTNTMFSFDENNSKHYYTKSKNEFSDILYDRLDSELISEIYLENTYHKDDNRDKIIPLITNAVLKGLTNPVKNKNEYFNLTFAEDVMRVFDSTLRGENKGSKTRLTSIYDLNIFSIFEYLNDYKMNGFINKDLLEITDSKYLINENIPKLNKNFNESNIFDNLITLLL